MPAVLRTNQTYRLLFTGQALSILGDAIAWIALPFAVLALDGGASGVALVAACQLVPFVLIGLPAGAWADRFDRRRLMLLADAIRFVAHLGAGLLLVTGRAEVVHLAIAALLLGTGAALFEPALTGILPRTVAASDLQPASALLGATRSAGHVAGPAIGALLVAVGSPGVAFLADAGTFAVSLATLALLRPEPEPPRADDLPRPTVRDGLTVIRERPWLTRGMVGVFAYSFLVLPAIYALGPLLADRELGGAVAWGAISTAFGVGALLGNVGLLRAWRPDDPLDAALACLVLASAQAAVIGCGLPLGVIVALELVCGIFVAGFWTLWETTLTTRVPSGALSRVAAFDFVSSSVATTAGVALGGVLAELIGLRTSLLGMSAVAVLVALALVRSERGARGTA